MEIDKQSEKCVMIKFLVKLGKNSQKIIKMWNTIYGDNALKKKFIFKWI